MRAVRLVALREIREGLRNRAFIATFVLTLVVIVGAVALPVILGGDEGLRLGVVPPTDLGADRLEAVAASRELDLVVQEVADEASGVEAIQEGGLDALLVGTTLVVEQTPNPALHSLVSEQLGQQQLSTRLAELGVDAAQLPELLSGAPPVEVRALEEPESSSAILFAIGGTILLLMGVTFFASSVLTGVVEEKSSRVVEVVLGAMRPWQLLAGKLLGIGSLAMAQVIILLVAAVAMIMVTGAVELPETTGETLAAVLAWFFLGFAFYSVVYAAAGSLVNRAEDAQSSAGPIGFLLFAAYFAVFAVVLPDPDGTGARVLSLVPGFAPLAMPARVALGAVTATEMVAAVAITLVATLFAIRIAARVYERSILRTEHTRWRDVLRERSDGSPPTPAAPESPAREQDCEQGR